MYLVNLGMVYKIARKWACTRGGEGHGHPSLLARVGLMGPTEVQIVGEGPGGAAGYHYERR